MEPPLIMDPVSLNTTEAADPVPVSQAQVRMIYGRRSSLLLGGTQIGVGLAVLMVNLVIRSTYDGYDGGRLIVYETIAVSWRCSAYCVPLASWWRPLHSPQLSSHSTLFSDNRADHLRYLHSDTSQSWAPVDCGVIHDNWKVLVNLYSLSLGIPYLTLNRPPELNACFVIYDDHSVIVFFLLK